MVSGTSAGAIVTLLRDSAQCSGPRDSGLVLAVESRGKMLGRAGLELRLASLSLILKALPSRSYFLPYGKCFFNDVFAALLSSRKMLYLSLNAEQLISG